MIKNILAFFFMGLGILLGISDSENINIFIYSKAFCAVCFLIGIVLTDKKYFN